MKTVRLSVLVAVALTMAATLLWVGCEESTTDMTIAVSPASIGVTNNHVITFVASLPGATTNSNGTAEQLDFPLEWNLSNWNLGTILEAKGDSAIYMTTPGRAGPNVITVTDQAGREGSAAIAQSVE
jgi:hypothetical protein